MPLTAGSQQKDYHALTGSEPDADWWISPQDANEGTPGNAVIATQLSDLYKAAYKAATEKTVSSGVLTVDQNSHTVQPETGTSDDINTISGMKADTFLVLYATDEGTDTLTFKHGTGNLSCFGAADVALSHGMVVCYYDGTVVYVTGGETNTGGWTVYSAVTPTRASADDPTYVLTFAGVDITGIISLGMKLKWTQDGSVRYGFVTRISFSTDTTLTLYGGTDYDVADTASFAITAFNYSTVKAPYGFPLSPSKWTEEFKDTVNRTQATPTASTWYNIGTSLINIPIGLWDVSFNLIAKIDAASAGTIAGYITLSTTNNSETDTDLTRALTLESVVQNWSNLYINKIFDFSTKDTYYLNMRSGGTSLSSIAYLGAVGTTYIRAVCAYL